MVLSTQQYILTSQTGSAYQSLPKYQWLITVLWGKSEKDRHSERDPNEEFKQLARRPAAAATATTA